MFFNCFSVDEDRIPLTVALALITREYCSGWLCCGGGGCIVIFCSAGWQGGAGQEHNQVLHGGHHALDYKED